MGCSASSEFVHGEEEDPATDTAHKNHAHLAHRGLQLLKQSHEPVPLPPTRLQSFASCDSYDDAMETSITVVPPNSLPQLTAVYVECVIDSEFSVDELITFLMDRWKLNANDCSLKLILTSHNHSAKAFDPIEFDDHYVHTHYTPQDSKEELRLFATIKWHHGVKKTRNAKPSLSHHTSWTMKPIKLRIFSPTLGSAMWLLSARPDMSVGALKDAVAEREYVPAVSIDLFCQDSSLDSTKTVEELGLKSGDVVMWKLVPRAVREIRRSRSLGPSNQPQPTFSQRRGSAKI